MHIKNKVKLGVTCLDHLRKQSKLFHLFFFLLISYCVINESCQPQEMPNDLDLSTFVIYHVSLHVVCMAK